MLFNKYKLQDITDKIGDGIHGTPKYKKDGKYYFINGNNLENGSIVIKNDTKKISEEEFKKNRKDLNENTILISINGTLGNIAKYNNEKIILGKSACYINVKKDYDVDYVYFVFRTSKFKKYLQYSANGTTIKNVPLSAIRNYEILVPNIDSQLKISKILKTIEKNININNEINDNLFNLININYKRYLNEVSKSDKTEEISVKDIFDFESGVEPGSKNYLEKEDKDTIKFYRVGDMDSDCKTFIKKDLANSKFINEDDIVVSFDATIGRIGYGLNGSFSTGMKKINVNNKYKNIIDNSVAFAYFNNPDTQNKILENAKGTTILHAGSAINFLNFKYNEELLIKYGKIISIFFQKMKQIKKENENLSNLRDTLLPKLMNGEIDLENIEI